MKPTTELLTFIKEQPKAAVFIVIIIALLVYQQYLEEKIRNPQKKSPHKRPVLPLKKQSKACGIIFGRKGRKVLFSPIEDEGHILCTAGSGGGKTSGLCIPSIRSACKDPQKCTCFCIDISGDIAKNCDIPNKLLFDIENEHTVPYNLFAEVDTETHHGRKVEILDELSYLIIPDMQRTGSNDASAYFQENARSMLQGTLIAFYEKGMDFVPICKKIISQDYVTLLEEIVDTGNQDAINRIASFSGCNEKNSSESKKTLDKYIRLFATNFRMSNAIRRPKRDEICISPQMLKTHNIFLQIPDEKADLYGPILGIFTAQAFHYCAARENGEKPTLLFVLDEYASLRINSDAILSAIRKYRKKNVRLMLLTQSITDLDQLYGSGASGTDIRKIIMANVRYNVILGSTDPETQLYYSNLIGKHEVRETSSTFSEKNISVGYRANKEFRVEPEAFGQLNNKLYLICNDGSYEKLKTNFYFKYR